MKITFVNHASVVLATESVRMICDPWLGGSTFNKGCGLLSPSAFRSEDFAGITHIWFSRGRPDHFHAPSLKAIPPAVRRRIVVLYRALPDGKIPARCERLGFARAIELSSDVGVELAPGFTVTSTTIAEDSWLHVGTPDVSLLNLDDCAGAGTAHLAAIKARTGVVDVLLTPFNPPAWPGNPHDAEQRRRNAEKALERSLAQARTLEPRWVIPFAGFTWFCHEENFHLNTEMITIDRVHSRLRDETPAEPIILYPGDEWLVGERRSPYPAIERYLNDLATIAGRRQERARQVDHARLVAAADAYCRRLRGGTSWLRTRARLAWLLVRAGHRVDRRERRGFTAVASSLLRLRLRPARIFLSDLDTAYLFDLRRGLRAVRQRADECDIVMSSDSLLYGFRVLRGGEALEINGRFLEVYPGGRLPLFEYFWLSSRLDARRRA